LLTEDDVIWSPCHQQLEHTTLPVTTLTMQNEITCSIEMTVWVRITLTSNVTGRHRDPQHKCMFVCQYVAPPGECYYNTVLCCAYYFSSLSVVSIARFLCPMHVFKVRASSLFPRLPLCQISFLSRPPLLS